MISKNPCQALVLGATGSVGQIYVHLLENHPFFHLHALAASDKWVGQSFETALEGRCKQKFYPSTLQKKLCSAHLFPKVDVVFSALKSKEAKEIEEEYAKRGAAVFSHGSYHRMEPDLPLIIPEINGDHLDLISHQQAIRGWKKGFIVVKPNCTLQSFLLPLYPLHQAFSLKQAVITTMQSISGAGIAFDLKNNILPYIDGEEEKSENEPLKILGTLNQNHITLEKSATFSVHCNRVPIEEGHMACVSASFERPLKEQQVRELWHTFQGEPQLLKLPSAPKRPLHYFTDPSYPQPLMHNEIENGMGIAIGRLRSCSIFDLRFTALSHNLIRGAAGGSLLAAELAYKKGYIKKSHD